jgi:hypothetical protein
MSLHISTQFEGNYLSALDFKQEEPTELQIAKVIPTGTTKSADGRVIDRPTLHFKGTDKGIILCKTNARGIARKLGPDMETWVGHKVPFFQARITAFGEADTPAIRVWGAPVAKKGGRRR